MLGVTDTKSLPSPEIYFERVRSHPAIFSIYLLNVVGLVTFIVFLEMSIQSKVLIGCTVGGIFAVGGVPLFIKISSVKEVAKKQKPFTLIDCMEELIGLMPGKKVGIDYRLDEDSFSLIASDNTTSPIKTITQVKFEYGEGKKFVVKVRMDREIRYVVIHTIRGIANEVNVHVFDKEGGGSFDTGLGVFFLDKRNESDEYINLRKIFENKSTLFELVL